MIDIVTVYHNATNKLETEILLEQLNRHEPENFNFYPVSNMEVNHGFAKGCNIGASQGNSLYIGFINPDVSIGGLFIDTVKRWLEYEETVITGNRFNKPQPELTEWGCEDWVCGATLFVRRDFFESVNGFDERFVWAWEETDLIRQAQQNSKICTSIDLPLYHDSPSENTFDDAAYKNYHFERGRELFIKKWGRS